MGELWKASWVAVLTGARALVRRVHASVCIGLPCANSLPHTPQALAPQIHRKGNQRSELLTALLTDQR